VPHGLKQFARKFGLVEEWKAELELVPEPPAGTLIDHIHPVKLPFPFSLAYFNPQTRISFVPII
jgi:hypothetical protein